MYTWWHSSSSTLSNWFLLQRFFFTLELEREDLLLAFNENTRVFRTLFEIGILLHTIYIQEEMIFGGLLFLLLLGEAPQIGSVVLLRVFLFIGGVLCILAVTPCIVSTILLSDDSKISWIWVVDKALRFEVAYGGFLLATDKDKGSNNTSVGCV